MTNVSTLGLGEECLHSGGFIYAVKPTASFPNTGYEYDLYLQCSSLLVVE